MTVNDLLANLGGISGSIIGVFAFVDAYFGGVFRELDLSISFRRLQENKSIVEDSDLFSKQSRYQANKHIERLGTPFYIRFWCFKTCPFCIFNCCCSMEAKLKKSNGQSKRDDPTF